jgi:hypothetical protein
MAVSIATLIFQFQISKPQSTVPSTSSRVPQEHPSHHIGGQSEEETLFFEVSANQRGSFRLFPLRRASLPKHN